MMNLLHEPHVMMFHRSIALFRPLRSGAGGLCNAQRKRAAMTGDKVSILVALADVDSIVKSGSNGILQSFGLKDFAMLPLS